MPGTNGRVEQLGRPDDFRKVVALATGTALILMTVVAVSRRLSGAFQGPVSAATPCVIATLAAIFSLTALALWTAARGRVAPLRARVLPGALAVLLPVVLGAALWISPSALVGGYLAALAMASLLGAVAIDDSAVGFALTNQMTAALFQDERVALAAGPPVSSSRVSEAATCEQAASASLAVKDPIADLVAEELADDEESKPTAEEEGESDDSVVQWMTRRRLADGGEVIEGAVQIDMDPAEQVGVAHLSFVPPLSCDPRAECHLLGDFDGRVRLTLAKSYGLRIEVRQSGQSTAPATVKVAFTAQAPPAASCAAAA